MLSLIGTLFKLTLFTALVLVLGHLIHWQGRSISDQVKFGLSSAQRSTPVKQVKRKSASIIDESRTLVQDASEAIQKRTSSAATELKRKGADLGGTGLPSRTGAPRGADVIPHDEREELNSLLEKNDDRGETI